MNTFVNEQSLELRRLNTSYLEPAKILLSQTSNKNGNLCASALLLLCLMDRLSQLEETSENSKEERFKRFWQKTFPASSQKSDCGKYELFPAGTSADRASEIVYALFRCSLVHNGGSLKQRLPSGNCDWAKKLGDWFTRHDEFEIVNRGGLDYQNAPVFCLNIEKDKKGHIEITLDVDKLLKKAHDIVTVHYGNPIQTMVVTASAAN